MALNLEGVTYRQEMIKCGKTSCNNCPHGPYWYAYWHNGPRLRKKYVGRNLPEAVFVGPVETGVPPVPLTQRERDFLQCEVMVESSFTTTRRSYRRLAVYLTKQIKASAGLEIRGEFQDELASLKGAFKRLFPNRR